VTSVTFSASAVNGKIQAYHVRFGSIANYRDKLTAARISLSGQKLTPRSNHSPRVRVCCRQGRAARSGFA
jgi:hypothetical protein